MCTHNKINRSCRYQLQLPSNLQIVYIAPTCAISRLCDIHCAMCRSRSYRLCVICRLHNVHVCMYVCMYVCMTTYITWGKARMGSLCMIKFHSISVNEFHYRMYANNGQWWDLYTRCLRGSLMNCMEGAIRVWYNYRRLQQGRVHVYNPMPTSVREATLRMRIPSLNSREHRKVPVLCPLHDVLP